MVNKAIACGGLVYALCCFAAGCYWFYSQIDTTKTVNQTYQSSDFVVLPEPCAITSVKWTEDTVIRNVTRYDAAGNAYTNTYHQCQDYYTYTFTTPDGTSLDSWEEEFNRTFLFEDTECTSANENLADGSWAHGSNITVPKTKCWKPKQGCECDSQDCVTIYDPTTKKTVSMTLSVKERAKRNPAIALILLGVLLWYCFGCLFLMSGGKKKSKKKSKKHSRKSSSGSSSSSSSSSSDSEKGLTIKLSAREVSRNSDTS